MSFSKKSSGYKMDSMHVKHNVCRMAARGAWSASNWRGDGQGCGPACPSLHHPARAAFVTATLHLAGQVTTPLTKPYTGHQQLIATAKYNHWPLDCNIIAWIIKRCFTDCQRHLMYTERTTYANVACTNLRGSLNNSPFLFIPIENQEIYLVQT